MTDKELINDLKYKVKHMSTGDYMFLPDILDLINRQQAEINRQKAEIEKLQLSRKQKLKEIERLNALIAETNEYRGEVIHAITHIDEVKAEAIKEFMNTATSLCYEEFKTEVEVAHTFAEIITKAKEMVGEDK